tara:strand:+ start:1251 stop:1586 length:336 start_codon:yes stop_codon:yes gene_type:complete
MKMRATLAAIVLGTTLAGVSACASAEMIYHRINAQCIPYDDAVSWMQKHGERIRVMAITQNDNILLEFWAQDGGAIWTALLHKAEEDLACLIDSGPTNVDTKNFIEKGLAN